ncbi:uncharacterized protein [Miscanthus floridulus]|uniref:uncharacterized protein n=1 Tax=Miscanthus floridulus TaxID=154761 RepID=UPI0034584BC4
MQIDWQHKWVMIPYGQSTVRLQGKLRELPEGSVIQVTALSSDDHTQQEYVPQAVSELLKEFESVFAPLAGYPPARLFDHAIPLILGASPMQVRPYRYPPLVKDKIKRQVTEMLDAGIIQPSKSPFSSSVLLVKKKDGTFRFCVDFCHLNAITANAKYLVLVIEELLDELTHASWFTCLDLTAGYHQIRLQPQWLQEVVASYASDSHAQQIIAKLVIDPSVVPYFTYKDGLLRYDQRVWIDHHPDLQHRIIAAMHDSTIGGHSGIPVTYRHIKQLFAWPGLKSAVQKFVRSCLTCQQAKPDRSRLPGLLQPLPVPNRAWQIISMDFIEGLPVSGVFNCILVVVDTFSKYAHFIALKHPFTAATVAKLFLSQVYKLHGYPMPLCLTTTAFLPVTSGKSSSSWQVWIFV